MRTLAAVLVVLAACKSESPTPSPATGSGSGSAPVAVAPKPTPAAPSDPAALVKGHNNFAIELYGKLPAGNVAVSPASITMALAMTWVGAKGATADELAQTLHLGGDQPAVLSHWAELTKKLVDPNRPFTLELANRLFVDQHRELDTIFFDINMKTFGARTDVFDFQTQAEESRKKINVWVGQETQQKIKDLLPPGSVTAATRLVIVNAIYFLADWATPFDKAATSIQPFHVSPAEVKQAPTMHRTGSYRIAHDKGATLLELPYKGGDVTRGADVSMYVLLPDLVDGLPAVEANLAETLRALQAKVAWAQVQIALPKFTIDPATPLDLQKPLSDLGIKLAFTPSADFSGISKDAKDPLFITSVLHKAFVKVDEKGTEAAAATAVVAVTGAAPTTVPILFTADHPFVFVIVDRITGLILFIGRVASP